MSLLGKSSINEAWNIEQLRKLARARLPKFIFDYLEGGADDEVTLARNRSVFPELYLMQRILKDISGLATETEILGEKVAAPIILSSTGANRMFHTHGEAAIARAAAKAGIIQALACTAMTSFDEVAAAGEGSKWCQMYVLKDRGFTRELNTHCRQLGYKALVLTVDCTVSGNRERDYANRLTIPPSMTPQMIWQLLQRPSWVWDYLCSKKYDFPNFAGATSAKHESGTAIQWFAEQFDRSFDWRDAAKMGEEWNGPFIIKGMTSVEDARMAVEIGAQGIVLSNHGGRQLDHAPPIIEVIEEVVNAVGDKLEVFVDSGFKRGTDIIKALALGAKACLVGRAYLYGLAAGGEAGVTRTIEILRSELERDMGLMGICRIDEVNRACVRWRKQ